MIRRDPLANLDELIPRVYAFVAYRLGDGPDAEDATADVFERALRYRGSYNAHRGEPISWLIGIARRVIADRPPVEHAQADLDPGTAEPQAGALDRLVLDEALSGLSERDRELIALRYGADLTARSIARITGLRTNAVEVALHRALQRLRDLLGDQAPDEPEGPAPPALRRVRI